MKSPFLLLLFVSLWSRANNTYPNPNIDIIHYRFYIELNDTTDVIVATAEITVLFKKQNVPLALDLVGPSTEGLGMKVDSVLYNEKHIPFTHQKNRLVLATQARSGEQRIYKIYYTGTPSDGLIIAKNKFGDRTFFGDNWPERARHWLCCIDHPSDKAGCEFVVIAPEHYQVIANGIKVEQTNLSHHRTLTHWKTEQPLPTKVMVIGVGRFAVSRADDALSSIPVTTWVYPQNKEDGFFDFSIAPKVLDYFRYHVAPYPYKKLANVQSKTRYGGMENASAIFYFENSVNGNNERETLIAHEIAHQWFGNSVSELSWEHVWLSEGFATYFTNLYMEHTYGFDKLQQRMRDQRQTVIDYYHEKSNHPIIDTLAVNINHMLNPNSYQKGSWVLHMLRHELGDVDFWKGIRSYYRLYQGGNALTRHFQTVMETVSGKKLQLFFDQWLRQSGHPILSMGWKYRSRKKKVDVIVEQEQSIPFVIPLEIGIREVGGKLVKHRVNLQNKQHTFSFSLGKKPLEIVLDPDVWLLFQDKTAKKPLAL